MSEFKTNDYVVLVESGTSDDLLQVIERKYSDDVYRVKILATKLCGPVHKREIRLATKEEIKAGKRLDDIKLKVSFGFSLMTPERVACIDLIPKTAFECEILDKPENHISPNCKAKDV